MPVISASGVREFFPEEIARDTARMRDDDRARKKLPLTTNEVYELMIRQNIQTLDVDDNTALRMSAYYPEWSAGVFCAVGLKVQRNGRLWKVVQAHTSQVGWEPENAASLWTQICETHDGTEADPIPYEVNMALENGKYYEQGNVVYRCFRDTINPVYHALSDLVRLYVEVAD